MAEARRSPTIDPDVSGDDTYESSTKEQGSTAGRIDALNYVSADHPLLPPRRVRSTNSMIEKGSHIWHHTAFRWDAFLAIQEDKNIISTSLWLKSGSLVDMAGSHQVFVREPLGRVKRHGGAPAIR